MGNIYWATHNSRSASQYGIGMCVCNICMSRHGVVEVPDGVLCSLNILTQFLQILRYRWSSRYLHPPIYWSFPLRQKQNSSQKMTHCHSESFHDSRAWHHCSLWRHWRGVKGRHSLCACSPVSCSCLPMVLAEWLIEAISAHRMSAGMAVTCFR